ncbi:MAG: PQQ-binding-like beta-propeller repeat protein [Thermoguttaceae bacterium]|jgi:Ca-activated chloride channel family protein
MKRRQSVSVRPAVAFLVLAGMLAVAAHLEAADRGKAFRGQAARQLPPEEPVPAVQAVDQDDVLAEATRQNSTDYPEPPAPPSKRSMIRPQTAKLRVDSPGHGHFRVHLSDGEGVLSPAVAEGRVFVGGGFSSTAFYCLNAETGGTLWSVGLADNGPSAPSYEDGTVVFTTESCTCYVLDAATGRGLWSVLLGNTVISTPTIAGRRVLVSYPAAAAARSRPSKARNAGPAPTHPQPTEYVFAARDLRTGKPLWQRWVDGFVMSAPVLGGKDAYIVTFAGTLYKFRLADGAILLARRCRATSAPVILRDGIYLTRRADDGRGGMPQECVVRLDPRTGTERYAAQACNAPYLADAATRDWLAQWGASGGAAGRAATPPAAKGRSAARDPAPGDPDYVPGGVPVPPPADGTPSVRLVGRGQPKELQAFCGSRLAALGDRLFRSTAGELVAADRATGAAGWRLDLSGPAADGNFAEPAAAPPALVNGKLFVAGRNGQLLCVDAASGKVLGRTRLGAPAASQPIIQGGRVFVGTTRGELVSIKTTDPRLGGWNQWGGDAAHSGVAALGPPAGEDLARND